MLAMILSTRSGPSPGSNRGQPAGLHRRADQPGAATAARFQVGIDLLREHFGTLAVQSRRKRLTRNVTPHPCIVAHARSARKDSRNNRRVELNRASNRPLGDKTRSPQPPKGYSCSFPKVPDDDRPDLDRVAP